MKEIDWLELDRIVQAALELRGDERARYVDEACGDDRALRREVQELLAADDAAEAQDLWQSTPLGITPPTVGSTQEWSQVVNPAPALEVGDTPGGYRLLETLGVGGSGRVFAAQKQVSKNQDGEPIVALKAIDTGLGTAGLEARFLAEREILSRLDHPYIARLLDGGRSADGHLFFVMDKVDGKPIDRYCADRGLDLRSRLQLMVEVCDAVSYAHRRLIVHRDIKPANLLVTDDGEPRLLDFGIAKLLDPDAFSGELPSVPGAHRHTQTGLMPMTPSYAAPEQMLGEDLTTATDVYALGVLLYQLVTGVRPYDLKGLSPLEQMEKVCEEPIVSAVGRLSEPDGAERRPPGLKRLPPDLEAVLQKALARDPRERYPSAGDLGADLERVLADEPSVAALELFGPGSWKAEAHRLYRRHRGAVLAGSGFLLLLLGLGLILFFQTVFLAQETHIAERERGVTLVASHFILELFSETRTGTPDQGISVDEWVDRGVERLRLGLADRPRARARLLHTLARVSWSNGHLEKAESLLLEGIDDLQRLTDVAPEEIGPMVADLLRVSARLKGEDVDAAEQEARRIEEVLDSRHNLLDHWDDFWDGLW